jgi:antitoxin ChpS
MPTATLRKVGGSTVMAIPRAMLDQLNVSAGEKVALDIQDGKLIVAPEAQKPKYTLAQLMHQSDPHQPAGAAERAWLEDSSIGDESI